MKIDIITLHRVRNYGSSLQTLATQTLFENYGVNVEFIDYYPKRYHTIELLKRLKNKNEKLKNNIFLLFGAQVIMSISYLRKKIVFDSFLKKYIFLTKKCYSSEAEIIKYYPQADAYCTGSDQVWNSLWNEGIDKPFYLSFVKKNAFCFSFASSFGNSNLLNEEKETVKKLLKRYSYISVREKDGINILNDMRISNVFQVLDPTLMFDSKYWIKFVKKNKKYKKYVLTYNLHHDKKLDDYAYKLAKSKGLKLINLSCNLHDILKKGKLSWCPRIEAFLTLISNSEFVITDSFHATVFSLIFHRKFVSIYPKEASSRIESILKLVSLENRGTRNYDLSIANNDIDYELVDKILIDERNKTNEYIKLVLKEIKND